MGGISNTQEGIVTQAEFAKLVILTTNGDLEPSPPLADDEGVDFIIHLRHQLRRMLCVQVKSSKKLRMWGQSPRLLLRFSRRVENLVTDPAYWYFFGHLDVPNLKFSDPVFFAPSTFVHKHARNGVRHGRHRFQIHASLAEDSKDKWVRWRVPQRQLGPRIAEELRNLPISAQTRAFRRLRMADIYKMAS